jgi:hypothetical protein
MHTQPYCGTAAGPHQAPAAAAQRQEIHQLHKIDDIERRGAAEAAANSGLGAS